MAAMFPRYYLFQYNVLQFRIMPRIYQIGINYVSEQLRLVHILTYHAVSYVYG